MGQGVSTDCGFEEDESRKNGPTFYEMLPLRGSDIIVGGVVWQGLERLHEHWEKDHQVSEYWGRAVRIQGEYGQDGDESGVADYIWRSTGLSRQYD